MYQQFNEQFAAATRQFADTAAQANQLALDNAQAVFGLQMTAINDRASANFAFWSEAAEARDFDSLKTLAPKAAQLARENVERAVGVGQEAFGRTVKTNEQIGEIAKSQVETAARATRENVEQAAKAATDKAEANFAQAGKSSRKAK